MPRIRRRMISILKWSAICIVGLVVVVVLSLKAFVAYSRHNLHEDVPPPGQMVNIGTHSLHLYCVGSGSPTVILESGGFSFSAQWALVMEKAEPITRVCAYDRSGLGWSEPAPDAPDADSVLQDLSELLSAAGELRPYVLVGHSNGGPIAWLYAHRHRGDMAGLIIVDGAPLLSLDADEIQGGVMGINPPAALLLLERWGILAVPSGLLWGDLEPAGYPDWAVLASERGGFLSTGALADLATGTNFLVLSTQARDFGDMPLIVIVADERAVASEFNFDRDSDDWRARQESMEMAAQVSTNGHLVQAADGIGHFIPRDAPEYVVDAIRQLVTEFRSGQ